MIHDKKKVYYGALTKIEGVITSVQMHGKNQNGLYEVFPANRTVTFVTNADTISIDGLGKVKNPVVLLEGVYFVTFSKSEHATETIKIVVDKDLTVTKNLVRNMGTLTINSSPSGATVTINNVNKGSTPLTLGSFPMGSYAVSLTKANYKTDTFNLNFNTHPQTVNRTLQQTSIPAPEPKPPTPPISTGALPSACGSIKISSITKNSAVMDCCVLNGTTLNVRLGGNIVQTIYIPAVSTNVYLQHKFTNLKANTTYRVGLICTNQYGLSDLGYADFTTLK